LHPAITRRRHKALHWAFLGLGVLCRAAAGAFVGGALRTRRFAGRRCSACSGTGAEAGTGWSAESGASAKAGTRAGSAGRTGAAGSGIAGAGGMLGARAAWELAGSSARTTESTLRITAGTAAWAATLTASRAASGPAIEDGPAALNPRTGGLIAGAGRNSGRLHDGRFVDGTRPGLGHDHAADGWRGWRNCVVLRARRRRDCRLWFQDINWG
jgi:hypothetical protein